MKLRTMLVVAGLFLTAGYAVAETAQQQMKTCNAEAAAKSLKGAERKAFMKTCLSARGETAAAKPASAQQEKMKTCNIEAKAKKLKGAERQAFIKACLSGSK